MKKCVAMFLIGVMLVSIIPVIGAITVTAAVEDNNLFIGGDFNDAERGVGYFKADYEADPLVYLPNGGPDGSGCVGIPLQQKEDSDGEYNICMLYDDGNGYNLPLYSGHTYTMSCMVKKPSQSGAHGYVAFLNMGIMGIERNADGSERALAYTAGNDEWIFITRTFTVPDNPANTMFRIYGGYQYNAGETMVLIDDVSIVDVTPATNNLFMNGDLNNADFGVGYFRAMYDSSSLTYLADGGVDGTGCIGLNMDPAKTSGNVCLMYSNGAGGYALPIFPGRTYTMSCDVWKPSGTNGTVEWLNMDFQSPMYDNAGEIKVYTNLYDQWVHLERTFTVPEDRTDMIWRIFGGFSNNNQSSNLIKIDNISLVDVTPYGENLLVGGDMESQDLADAYYTITYDGGTRTWLPHGGAGGSACMELSVNGSGNNALIHPIYNGKPLEIGKTYTVSCDVFVPHNTLQFYWIDLEGGDSSDFNSVLNGWEDPAHFPWNYRFGQWQRIQSTFTYDGHAFGLRFYGPSCENADTEAKIRIDNLSLRCTDPSVKRVASINGMAYTSLDAAYAVVQPNEAVSLQNDMTVSGYFCVPVNVTLDLNGYTLTVDNFFSFGQVIDSSNGKGGVQVSNDRTKAFVQIQQDNASLPLYDAENGCYRFYNYSLMFKTKEAKETYNRYAVRLDLPTKEAYDLLADQANHNMLSVWLLMTKEDGATKRINYYFSSSTIASYAKKAAVSEQPQAILLTVKGVNAIDQLTIEANAQVKSQTGMMAAGDILFDYEQARAWIEEQIENDTIFSFEYDGKAYKDHIGNWEKSVERTDDGWIVSYVYQDVTAWSEISLNAETASVEWTNYFKNNGTSNSSAISNVRAINSSVTVENPMFTSANGSDSQATDFQPYSIDLNITATHTMQTSNGRSSEGTLPYFEISNGEYGVMGGIGWTGNWNANFANTNGVIHIDAGMQQINTYLKPNEQMRTPMIMLQFYKGNQDNGHNAFRELILKKYTPVDSDTGKALKNGRFYNAVVDRAGLGEQTILNDLYEIDNLNARYDILQIDAGWYGDESGHTLGNGEWVEQVGNWYFIPGVYQDNDGNGARDIQRLSNYLKAQGKDLMLWFEPERVYRGYDGLAGSIAGKTPTKLYKEHPEFLLDGGETSSRMWNFADDDACDYMIDLISDIIKENGVDWYRQDQNAINPDDYWTYNDEPGRTGMMEIRYITNFYRYMDALVENNPGLMIDNCAQGGRRLDLEMMKRSIPFWNSDYGNSDSATPNGIRNINYNLSWWLPIHGGKYPIANYDYLGSSATDYRFRTAMTSCMGFDMGNALNGRNQQLMDQYYTCRELMSGEYYILDEADAGVGYEFYKADADKGYLLFFGDTGYVHGYKLKGLQANAMYSVISADTGVRRVYTGAALMTNGFTVSHAENSQSQLFYINEL